MAQKRMLDKKISVSEQVADLPVEAQLIFTWSIPHSDDLGLLPYSPRVLKAMVVPMWDITIEKFTQFLDAVINQKVVEPEQPLYKIYTHTDGSKWLRITKFNNYQTLKKDRSPNTYLPDISSWKEVETLGFLVEDIGNPIEVKGSKDNKRKDIKESFDLFWSKYPRKVSKATAIKSWAKIEPDSVLLEKILAALELQKNTDQWKKDGGQFIPHASTWLNQRRWEDEVAIVSERRKVDKL